MHNNVSSFTTSQKLCFVAQSSIIIVTELLPSATAWVGEGGQKVAIF